MVGASRHPLLMDDPIARDVLWWMADAAQERNDCRIILAVDKLADAMDRPSAAVRKAQERMLKAGLLDEDGRGDYNKRVRVMRINEQGLDERNQVITHEVSHRNDSASGATNLPSPCPDPALTLPQPCPDAALMLPSSCPDPALYAGARFEQEQEHEPEHEPEHEQVQRGGRLEDAREATDPAAAAWAMWCEFITKGRGTVVDVERVIITDTVERYGLERTQSAIASLIDCRNRPKVGWVRDRAKKDHDAGGVHSTRAAVRTTRGGVRLGAPLTELDPNEW